jgi:hypothetical protein
VGRRKKPDYIPMRMKQLEEERDNPNNNDYDSLWYNRIIQELDWAQQAINKTAARNCYMSSELPDTEGDIYELRM